MAPIPHPDDAPGIRLSTAVITVSDTRTPDTDHSGQLMQQLLRQAGHGVTCYQILPDEPLQIQAQLTALTADPALVAILCNGGTGIAPRDTTYDAIAALLEKQLPGFGELFRWLSFQEIGSRAIASRAVAGLYRSKLIFALPGSTKAVRLGMEQLILPELVHLSQQVRS
ncbi:molybdenum cofactor biosynthesis protein B [Neosynechococcus sphagnicola sy1]|uniref:Molybdenum cofactor biosynthesis protein B n=1 Tax=Neosynechococcus sphagnicola sy1 TaxID=1497020 RepID=A0A098TI73_9CYAN|nr:MogA/MoaB family molybdenum cofactor biosynthesis protein [Neosynechococcus sphagnicola]KGF71809.1 molybdenum cofactor biosynthesis protein B [Neosynechococcus sphagnicola sy1]